MTFEDEVFRRLKKRAYKDLADEMRPVINSFRQGEIGPYELASELNSVIHDCGWTTDEVRDYEKEYGIVWAVYYATRNSGR